MNVLDAITPIERMKYAKALNVTANTIEDDGITDSLVKEAVSLIEVLTGEEVSTNEIKIGGELSGDENHNSKPLMVGSAKDELKKQLAIADKLEAEYGYLPAPNGEQSNLNKQQWAQVRTPQFKAWFGDWEGVSIVNGQSIVSLKTEDAPIGGFKDVEAWAESVFNSQGGKANRIGFGTVTLDKRAAKDSLAHGGANLYKKTAFLAVKDVIEKGALIHSESNGVEDSFYFSAPVTIDGVVNIETVLVHRDVNTNRMYLHSVSTKENLMSQRVSSADNKSSKHSSSIDSKGVASLLNGLLNGNSISKVVDANGEPLVVYHGTKDSVDGDGQKFKADFTEPTTYSETADGYPLRSGFFTSSDKEVASGYAGGGIVYPLYLNIKKPAFKNAEGRDWKDVFPVKGTIEATVRQVRSMSNLGFDGLVLRNIKDYGDSEQVDNVADTWVAINPNQIKSATGNNGNFDPNSNKILDSITPLQRMKYASSLQSLNKALAGELKPLQRIKHASEASKLVKLLGGDVEQKSSTVASNNENDEQTVVENESAVVVGKGDETLSIEQAIDRTLSETSGTITTGDSMVWELSKCSLNKMVAKTNKDGDKPYQTERIKAIQNLKELAFSSKKPLIRQDNNNDGEIESIYEYLTKFSDGEKVFSLRLLCKKYKKPNKRTKDKMHSMAVMDKTDNPINQIDTDGQLFDLEISLLQEKLEKVVGLGLVSEQPVTPSVDNRDISLSQPSENTTSDPDQFADTGYIAGSRKEMASSFIRSAGKNNYSSLHPLIIACFIFLLF